MTRGENGHLEKLLGKVDTLIEGQAEHKTDLKWMKGQQKKDDAFREKYAPVLDKVIEKVDDHERIIRETKGSVKIAKWLGGIGGIGGLGAALRSLFG